MCLTQEIRNTNPVWDTNQIYIEAVESPMATIVSFCITDAGLTVRFRTIGDSPSVPLAILPVQPGKKLWVIARHVPEGKMKEWADIGIRHFNARLAVDANLVEKTECIPQWPCDGIMCKRKHLIWRQIYDAFPCRSVQEWNRGDTDGPIKKFFAYRFHI